MIDLVLNQFCVNIIKKTELLSSQGRSFVSRRFISARIDTYNILFLVGWTDERTDGQLKESFIHA